MAMCISGADSFLSTIPKSRPHFDNYNNGDSAVGIATGKGLVDRRVGVRVPAGGRFLSSPRHSASYLKGNGGSFSEGKAAESST
jgi:hypothetical protein